LKHVETNNSREMYPAATGGASDDDDDESRWWASARKSYRLVYVVWYLVSRYVHPTGF
jgi:hypothetical protein